jgi:hypothetical protein
MKDRAKACASETVLVTLERTVLLKEQAREEVKKKQGV